ncbi:MAG: TonB-dependent receptor domain-containing protein [Betaproteobacteria bacterium]
MQKRTKVAAGVMLAIGTLAATGAWAQGSQRVEVTGSSIKRIAAEGALPVITISREEIDKSGATSTQELIQNLPSMQGFVSSAQSVNGGGGGVTTASLRDLGTAYTLVLLNGRRVAPYNTGSSVNLEQLPLSAIERIEILADGASAIYGSDAIAGVVNFITKANTTAGGIDIKVSRPQAAGGDQNSVSFSKGFGNFDKDGFNVLVGASFQKDQQIKASEREFSKTGVFPFSYQGTNYWFYQTSGNANPPNIQLYSRAGSLLANFSPGALNGTKCGPDPASFQLNNTCRFDYASTVEAQPQAERKNFYGSASFKLNKDFRAFAEAMFSDVALYGRFAPPAQPLAMPVGGTLYNRYVVPYLTQLGVNGANVARAAYGMRLRDSGLRSNDYLTTGKHLVVGLDGQLAGFDVSAYYTKSSNDLDSPYGGGYVSRLKMNQLIDSGAWDPFAQGTAASRTAIAPAILRDVDSSRSSLDVLSLRGSGPLFNAPAGMAYAGLGADFTKQGYTSSPSPISQGPNAFQPNFADFPVGSSQGSLPFNSSRKSKGAFLEVQVPLMKSLEVTGALRYDSYDAVQNSANFDADLKPIKPAVQGNSASKSTYKLAFRLQPTQELLVRGSVGSGFRAPSLSQITSPLTEAGVVGNQYDCPAKAPDPLAAGCRSIPTQYKLQSGGNPFSGAGGLKPEKSDQATLGFRFEPNNQVTAGVDYWSVKIRDQITSVPESTAFSKFAQYRGLFTVTTDAATNLPILTFNDAPFNAAINVAKGFDFDVTLRNKLPFGGLTTQWVATYLTESYYDLGFGGGKEDSMGKYGSNGAVSFRMQSRLSNTLVTGPLAQTLVWKYRPGYKDRAFEAGEGTVRLVSATGGFGSFVDFAGLDVPAYSLFDYQARYAVNKQMTVTGGILNLFNKKPPLTLKLDGGNMVGFDPRYHDGRLRTFYVSAGYKF